MIQNSTHDAFNNAIEEVIYHTGYDIQFSDLDDDWQKRLLSFALRDPRFDLADILLDREFDIVSLVESLVNDEIDSRFFGNKVIESLLTSTGKEIDYHLQEAIGSSKEEMNANDDEFRNDPYYQILGFN